jgi:hypothetical protein
LTSRRAGGRTTRGGGRSGTSGQAEAETTEGGGELARFVAEDVVAIAGGTEDEPTTHYSVRVRQDDPPGGEGAGSAPSFVVAFVVAGAPPAEDDPAALAAGGVLILAQPAPEPQE